MYCIQYIIFYYNTLYYNTVLYYITLLPCDHMTSHAGVWADTTSFCWVCDVNSGMLPDNESEQGHLLPWRNEPQWLSTLIVSNKEPQHVWQTDSMRLLQSLTILNPWASYSTQGSPGRRQSIFSPGTWTVAGNENEVFLKSNPSAGAV